MGSGTSPRSFLLKRLTIAPKTPVMGAGWMRVVPVMSSSWVRWVRHQDTGPGRGVTPLPDALVQVRHVAFRRTGLVTFLTLLADFLAVVAGFFAVAVDFLAVAVDFFVACLAAFLPDDAPFLAVSTGAGGNQTTIVALIFAMNEPPRSAHFALSPTLVSRLLISIICCSSLPGDHARKGTTAITSGPGQAQDAGAVHRSPGSVGRQPAPLQARTARSCARSSSATCW